MHLINYDKSTNNWINKLIMKCIVMYYAGTCIEKSVITSYKNVESISSRPQILSKPHKMSPIKACLPFLPSSHKIFIFSNFIVPTGLSIHRWLTDIKCFFVSKLIRKLCRTLVIRFLCARVSVCIDEVFTVSWPRPPPAGRCGGSDNT